MLAVPTNSYQDKTRVNAKDAQTWYVLVVLGGDSQVVGLEAAQRHVLPHVNARAHLRLAVQEEPEADRQVRAATKPSS